MNTTNKKLLVLATVSTMFLACGSSNSRAVGAPGSSHQMGEEPAIDTPEVAGETENETETVKTTPDENQALVTFVLKNSSDESLFLNMDKGWGAVIYAFSGVPLKNAKSILMFPNHCTASCDAPKEEICPQCPELTRAKDIKKAENHDEVLPGTVRTVPWDTMVFSYPKKRVKGTSEGKRVRCKCYTVSEVPPETYTVKACGLRKTSSAKKPSKYQCVEGSITLPVTSPTVVELDFVN